MYYVIYFQCRITSPTRRDQAITKIGFLNSFECSLPRKSLVKGERFFRLKENRSCRKVGIRLPICNRYGYLPVQCIGVRTKTLSLLASRGEACARPVQIFNVVATIDRKNLWSPSQHARCVSLPVLKPR